MRHIKNQSGFFSESSKRAHEPSTTPNGGGSTAYQRLCQTDRGRSEPQERFSFFLKPDALQSEEIHEQVHSYLSTSLTEEERGLSKVYTSILRNEELPSKDMYTFKAIWRKRKSEMSLRVLEHLFFTQGEADEHRKKAKQLDVVTIMKDAVTSLTDAIADNEQNSETLKVLGKHHQSSIPVDVLKSITLHKAERLQSLFAELENSRKHHPRYQNQAIFDQFQKTLNLVNDALNVLISVDIEAFEFDTKKITEIGISIYDPSKEAFSSIPQFTTIHLLPKEFLGLHNGRFVPDHKRDFLCGPSIILPLNECTRFIDTIFHYFVNERAKQGFGTVIVGHDVRGDLKWLRSMNVKVPEDIPIADTQDLMKLTVGRQASLSKLLKFTKIPYSCLHNGANDAYFTLLFMLHITDPVFRQRHGLDLPNIGEEMDISLEEMKSTPVITRKPRKSKGAAALQYPTRKFVTHLEALDFAFN
jgi:hypothetical protein